MCVFADGIGLNPAQTAGHTVLLMKTNYFWTICTNRCSIFEAWV